MYLLRRRALGKTSCEDIAMITRKATFPFQYSSGGYYNSMGKWFESRKTQDLLTVELNENGSLDLGHEYADLEPGQGIRLTPEEVGFLKEFLRNV